MQAGKLLWTSAMTAWKRLAGAIAMNFSSSCVRKASGMKSLVPGRLFFTRYRRAFLPSVAKHYRVAGHGVLFDAKRGYGVAVPSTGNSNPRNRAIVSVRDIYFHAHASPFCRDVSGRVNGIIEPFAGAWVSRDVSLWGVSDTT